MPLVEHKEYEPFSDYDTYPSDELMAAVESTMTLGQTILEQHTPPKYYHQLPEWQNSIDNKRFRLNNNNNNNYDYVNSLNFK
ncbi:hypothetical protein O3M35_003494 [Rhynocoris fuscipes]|uniref:Uncharacterized protein n=1 Tax=Rhynocoris fuscipes TaxID=488301 RepID=A0AAW1CQ61_9HEMI